MRPAATYPVCPRWPRAAVEPRCSCGGFSPSPWLVKMTIGKHTFVKVLVLGVTALSLGLPAAVLLLLRPRSHMMRAATWTTAAHCYLIAGGQGRIVMGVNHMKDNIGVDSPSYDQGWVRMQTVDRLGTYSIEEVVARLAHYPEGRGIKITSNLPLVPDPPYLIKGTPQEWRGVRFERWISPIETIHFVIVPWVYAFVISLLPVTGVIGGLSWRWRKKLRRLARVAAKLCPECGYDCRASPGRCPECGNGP